MTDPAPLTEVRAGLDAHRELAGRLTRALDQAAASGTWTDWAEIRELQRRAGQVLEDDVVARLAALERVRAAVAQLADLGPVSEIVDRGPAHAADATGLDRVLLSRVEDGMLVAEALHVAGDPQGAAALLERLRAAPAALEYPLAEGELLRRRRPLLIRALPDDVPAERHAFGALLGRRDHVAAPIVLDGRVAGVLHGDRGPGVPVTALDRDALWTFAADFALVHERAVLRRRLRTQREELRQVATWADARTSELSDRAISLAPERAAPAPQSAAGSPALRDLLTRREVDVLELMVRGETNAGIARALVVAEGTIKFHVKNILRKLQAANRAEATSRYLRLTLRDRPPGR